MLVSLIYLLFAQWISWIGNILKSLKLLYSMSKLILTCVEDYLFIFFLTKRNAVGEKTVKLFIVKWLFFYFP